MYENLPIIPTSVIGSYAQPGWLHLVQKAAAAGEFGQQDLKEAEDDAVDAALRDQEDADVDIITDGEMRRVGFFTAEFYHHMTGLDTREQSRKSGVGGHDQREKYLALEPLGSPNGLGLLEEYQYVKTRTDRPIKMPIPGPFTLSGRIDGGKVYKDRMEVAWGLSSLVNAELKRLVAAGVQFIQMDEPSMSVHSSTPKEFVDLFNKTVEGVDAYISMHLCFGNYLGRPVAKRTYKPLLPHIFDMNLKEYALEFANRELAELDILREFPEDKRIAVGLIDVKNYYVETPEDVAERLRAVLDVLPPERVTVTPDCGFSQTARWAAKRKLQSMVAGTKIVRAEIS
ncbi:MAG: methionine synthase [Anaerolineaceae bacterium]|nr:methionine synthase [Anaerolineaceae bacterium]